MIIKTPEIPHDVLGITPTMQSRTVILKQMIYLVEHWRPATVPTEANPGSWQLAIPAYETEEEAGDYIASLPEEHRYLYRVRPFLSVEAREVWGEPGDKRSPRREAPKEAIAILSERVRALEEALRPFAEQNYSDLDALLSARRLLGLPDFPPIGQALAELREIVGSRFDGIDPVAYVAELRGDGNVPRA